MIRGAARMVGTRGAAGTSLRELAREAGVPFGSTYHHFPGGKHELVTEAVRAQGAYVGALIDRARTDGPAAALAALTDEWRRVLQRSDFHTGCAVLAVATEDEAELRDTANRVFASWRERLVEVLTEYGVTADRAPGLARTVVAAVEGAVALCRAERTVAPLEEVAVELRLLIDSAIGRAGSRVRGRSGSSPSP
jgi:TetR/AcrR family transcriptional regulator, lmrAB and yxaGH operons repressor